MAQRGEAKGMRRVIREVETALERIVQVLRVCEPNASRANQTRVFIRVRCFPLERSAWAGEVIEGRGHLHHLSAISWAALVHERQMTFAHAHASQATIPSRLSDSPDDRDAATRPR